jgi:hypothetical protein
MRAFARIQAASQNATAPNTPGAVALRDCYGAVTAQVPNA